MFTGVLVGGIVFVGFFAAYIVLLRAYDLQMQKNHGPNHDYSVVAKSPENSTVTKTRQEYMGVEVFDERE